MKKAPRRPRVPKFHLFAVQDGDTWYWWAHITAGNGRVVWTTETYSRRSWVRWSPAAQFLGGEIQRELEDRFTERELPSGPDGSNVKHHARCSGCEG